MDIKLKLYRFEEIEGDSIVYTIEGKDEISQVFKKTADSIENMQSSLKTVTALLSTMGKISRKNSAGNLTEKQKKQVKTMVPELRALKKEMTEYLKITEKLKDVNITSSKTSEKLEDRYSTTATGKRSNRAAFEATGSRFTQNTEAGAYKNLTTEVELQKRAELQARITKMQEDHNKRLIAEHKYQEKVNASLDKKRKLLQKQISEQAKNDPSINPLTGASYDRNVSDVSVDKDLIAFSEAQKSISGENLTVLERLKGVIDKVGSAFKNSANKVKESTNSLNENAGAADKNTKSWKALTKSLAGTFVRFRIISGGIQMIWRSMMSMVEVAAGFEETTNLFILSMGEYYKEAKVWADEISNALYLDPSNVYQYAGALNSLITGLGIAADEAYTMSTNLTQLAYDMSSYLNIDFQAAYDKIESGISGQIRGLRSVGVALTQASLQELAYELGVNRSVRTMSEAEKVYLRYIQIMRQTKNMQGDLARTLMTPQNALRVTQQQFILLARAVGQVFIPIIQKAIPYIMATTNLLTRFATALAEALGYEPVEIDYSTVKNLGSLIKDVGDEADSTAGKLNEMLAPFDDLNVVQSESSGSGKSDFDPSVYEKYINGYDMLAGLTGDFEEAAKKAEKTVIGLASAFGLLLAGGTIFKVAQGFKDTAKAAEKFPKLTKIKDGVKALGKGSLVNGLVIIAGAITTIVTNVHQIFKGVDDVLTGYSQGVMTLSEALTGLGINTVATVGLLAGLGLAIGGIPGLVVGAIAGIGLTINAVIKKGSEDAVTQISVLDKAISKATRKKLTPLVKEFENLDKTLIDLELSSKIIKDSDVSEIKQQLKHISTVIVNELDADKNQALKDLDTIKNTLGFDKYNDLIADINTYYSQQKALVEDNEKKINAIIKKARDEGRELTADEFNTINTLREQTLNAGLKAMSETDEEFAKLRIRMGQERNKLEITQASEYLQNAAKTRDKAIKTANEQYEGIVLEAQKLRDAGLISDEEYNDMVEAARVSRDSTIKSANEQYTGIYNETTKGLGKNSRYIDEETGKIRSKWDVFWGGLTTAVGDVWGKVKTKVSVGWDIVKKYITDNIFAIFTKKYWDDKLSGTAKAFGTMMTNIKTKLTSWKPPKFKLKWDEDGGKEATGWMKTALKAVNLPTKLPKLSIGWYEEGGFPTSGDLFFANENGVPEYITSIGGRSAVANQDQMVSALSGAIITAMSQIPINNGGRGDVSVYIGNKKVYQGQGEYQNRESDRYGTTKIVKV